MRVLLLLLVLGTAASTDYIENQFLNVDKRKLQQGVVQLRKRLWPYNEVQLDISKAARLHSVVHQAMAYLNERTCVKFLEGYGYHSAKVVYKHNAICDISMVGFTKSNPVPRKVTVSNRCPSEWHVISLLLQLAGHFPEHQHVQRDMVLNIHWSNIKSKQHWRYKRLTGVFGRLASMGVPYNYGSLTHFNQRQYALDPAHPTMTPRMSVNVHLGQRTCLQPTDLARLNRLYNCTQHYLGDDPALGTVPYKLWVTWSGYH